MGYRFGYLLVRTGYRSLREPTATGMVWGYLAAAARRKERLPDEERPQAPPQPAEPHGSAAASPRSARPFPLGLTRRARSLSRMRTADSPRMIQKRNGT